MQVAWNVPLASLTTLGLGGPAKRCVTAESERDIVDLVREVDSKVDAKKEPLLVVGGGSNLVVADEGFPGTVLRMASRGMDVREEGSGVVSVTVAAGEVWDDFVAHAARASWSGIECLSGIPGLVGAVPMQNVGAYGQDVGERITKVEAWDRTTGARAVFDREQCHFSYRSSLFRGSDRYVILSVTFALDRSDQSAPLRYAELLRALEIEHGHAAPLPLVRDTILRLRRGKGMVVDPRDADTKSAGSFFTNPILDGASFEKLRERVTSHLRADEKMPSFPEPDGRTKVSAAWLIERAGFTKGFGLPDGKVSLSTKHALALTNRGAATTADLLTLARTVRDGVFSTFGVLLENEPVFVGVHL